MADSCATQYKTWNKEESLSGGHHNINKRGQGLNVKANRTA